MKYITTDGGRAEAGFTGKRDCVCRAISIALQLPYSEVYDGLQALAARERPRRGTRSHPGSGVARVTYERYLKALGWTWTATMGIGTGCRVHLRAEELPAGRIICRVSRHLVAVIDGVLHDTGDPTRAGRRCVYGYYSKPPAPRPSGTIQVTLSYAGRGKPLLVDPYD